MSLLCLLNCFLFETMRSNQFLFYFPPLSVSIPKVPLEASSALTINFPFLLTPHQDSVFVGSLVPPDTAGSSALCSSSRALSSLLQPSTLIFPCTAGHCFINSPLSGGAVGQEPGAIRRCLGIPCYFVQQFLTL